MKVKLSSKTQTLFKFHIPYAIPVPDGVYPIKIGYNLGKLSIKRMQKANSKAVNESTTSPVKFDKYGRSSYSVIKLLVPKHVLLKEEGRSSILLEPELTRLKATEMIVRIVNRFIETTKHVSLAYWVEPLRYQDILSLQAFFLDAGKKYTAKIPEIESTTSEQETASDGSAQLNEEKIKQLKDALATDHKFDLSQMFILNSMDACSKEDYLLATIESVTALELVLYQSILEQGTKLGVHPNELKKVIATVGSTGNLDVVLKMLTNGLKQIDSDTINNCKGAITVRNNILHKGLRDVYSTDTEKRIIAIQKMIDYLQPV